MPSRCSAASPALSLRRRAAIGATLVAVIEDSQGGHGVTPDNFVIKTLNEWLAVSGDVGRQVKDLPPGTQLTLGSGDE